MGREELWKDRVTGEAGLFNGDFNGDEGLTAASRFVCSISLRARSFRSSAFEDVSDVSDVGDVDDLRDAGDIDDLRDDGDAGDAGDSRPRFIFCQSNKTKKDQTKESIHSDPVRNPKTSRKESRNQKSK